MNATVKVAAGGVTFGATDTSASRYGDFWSQLSSRKFEPGTVDVVAGFARPTRLFVDIGAWIGPFALLAAACGARVVAFEPDPVAAAALRANVRLNRGFGMLIDVRERALGGSARRASFGSQYGLGNARSHIGREGQGSTLVDVADAAAELSSLLASPGEAFIKIDVEGAEFEIVPRLAPLLRKFRPTVLVSIHQPLPKHLKMHGFTRLRRVIPMARLLWGLRSYGKISRGASNREAAWIPLRRWQRWGQIVRLGEFDLLATP